MGRACTYSEENITMTNLAAFIKEFYTPKTKSTTTDCKLIWDLIKSIPDEKLRNELSDAFCDFECSWSEHESEYHR
jgi:hypothetical protein